MQGTLVVVGDDHLAQEVERAGGDHEVVDVVDRRSASATVVGAALSERTPIIAIRRRPTDSGLVTPTTCSTPASISRCTRWRTAASDSPTAAPRRVYGTRPSACSCSMIARSVASSWVPVRSIAADHWPIAGRLTRKRTCRRRARLATRACRRPGTSPDHRCNGVT